jgi:hypothetical protein
MASKNQIRLKIMVHYVFSNSVNFTCTLVHTDLLLSRGDDVKLACFQLFANQRPLSNCNLDFEIQGCAGF